MTLERGRSRRLGELYAEHAPRAGRLAYLLVGNRDLAEDLVQEAFVRVSGKFWNLRNPDAFHAYLRQTVVNLARGHMRKRGREVGGFDTEVFEGRSQQPDIETRDELFRGLGMLPHRQRAAVVLRFYLDLSEQQTADLLGLPVGTVKSLVSRGREALRVHMREVMRDG